MERFFQGLGIGVLFGTLVMLLLGPKEPALNKLTKSQQELVDSFCSEAITITCTNGKTIGVKNGK